MRRWAAIAALVAALAAAPSAYADAIDGDWCSAKGLSLSIDGPHVRTPAGARIDGLYRRHEFAYEVPAGEEHGGETVYLQLIDETDMLFRWIKDGAASEPDLWHRCNVTSSLMCHRRIYSGDPWCHVTGRLQLLDHGSPQHVRG